MKLTNSERVTAWRNRVKERLLEGFGKKCGVCNYNKCVKALEFHHLDPSEKEFGIGCKTYQSWDKLVAEVSKCVLLCANCHREVHDDLLVLSDEIQRFDLSLCSYIPYESLRKQK